MARSGVRRPENTTMQQMQLWIFWAIVGVFIVCGCILTRKPTKKPPRETLRPAVPDEHQPGCFALEEERGGNWKGRGGAYGPVKKLNRVCDLRGSRCPAWGSFLWRRPAIRHG